jgi:uncharacterized protein YrrD
MLIKAKKLQGFKLSGVDDEVGKVKEFFFDDNFWAVRYLVVDTGGWLNDRQVLISPFFVKNLRYDSELIDVTLTKREIEESPPLESDMPISRHFEESYYGHFGAPLYYTGPYVWGAYPYVTSDRDKWADVPTEHEKSWDPNLRSTKDITKYNIQATDDEIGQVVDFIIDDETWEIRYFVIDTRKWLPGKKVLISPQWIEEIDLVDEKVHVPLSRRVIEEAPEYDEDHLTREYESQLYQYYNRQGYWSDEPVSREYRR